MIYCVHAFLSIPHLYISIYISVCLHISYIYTYVNRYMCNTVFVHSAISSTDSNTRVYMPYTHMYIFECSLAYRFRWHVVVAVYNIVCYNFVFDTHMHICSAIARIAYSPVVGLTFFWKIYCTHEKRRIGPKQIFCGDMFSSCMCVCVRDLE